MLSRIDPALQTMIQRSCEAAGADRGEAKKLLLAELRDAKDKSMTAEVIDVGAQELVDQFFRTENKKLFDGKRAAVKSAVPSRRSGSTLVQISNNVERSLMDFILPMGRMKLGDARRPIVIKNRDFYLKQGRTMTATGTWLGMICEKLKNDDTPVRKALTDETLDEEFVKAGCTPEPV